MKKKKSTVYLDQNVLTELRINRLYHNDFNFIKLLQLTISDKYTVVYSDITLKEIYNIGNKEYISSTSFNSMKKI